LGITVRLLRLEPTTFLCAIVSHLLLNLFYLKASILLAMSSLLPDALLGPIIEIDGLLALEVLNL
jgi:hypothetical protein